MFESKRPQQNNRQEAEEIGLQAIKKFEQAQNYNSTLGVLDAERKEAIVKQFPESNDDRLPEDVALHALLSNGEISETLENEANDTLDAQQKHIDKTREAMIKENKKMDMLFRLINEIRDLHNSPKYQTPEEKRILAEEIEWIEKEIEKVTGMPYENTEDYIAQHSEKHTEMYQKELIQNPPHPHLN